MKLPGINYSTPVQSLGRGNIALPGQVAGAKAKSLSAITGAISDVANAAEQVAAANETAVVAANLQRNMSSLNAEVGAKNFYSSDELVGMGITFRENDITKTTVDGIDQMTETTRAQIPAYEVVNSIYEKRSKELYQEAISGVSSRKGRNAITKAWGIMSKDGMKSTAIISAQYANAHAKVQADTNFDLMVQSGNEDGAIMIAETALATGAWSDTWYGAKAKGLGSRIDHASFVSRIGTNDVDDLNDIAHEVLGDENRMDSSKKSSLYTAIQTKITRLENETESDLKIERDKSSLSSYVEMTSEMLGSGNALPWSVMKAATANLTREDSKAIMAINRSLEDKVSKSDKDTMIAATVKVRSLSLPSEKPASQRRGEIVDYLVSLTGVDPNTGQVTGPSKLSAADFSGLMDDINTSQKFVYDSPEIKAMVDYIWPILTGGAKDFISNVMGAGDLVINAAEAERDMLSAASDAGPSFNPKKWWSVNKNRYLLEAYQENVRTLTESRYVVNKGNGMPDMEKTSARVNAEIKSKYLTEKEGRAILDRVAEVNRLKAQLDEKQEQ